MSFIPTEYSDPIFVYSLRNVFPRYGGPLVRVIRESDHIEGDVYPDDNGEVSYDSTIIVNPSETSALVLGEFLNIDGYTDADGLGEVYEGRLSKIYDQSAGSFDVGVNTYSVSFLFVETNLPAYGGSTAIHKVNGVPAFFATAIQPMFKLAQARGREVSYHFMTEGVGATQYFGFIGGVSTYGIWGLHDIEAEITSATLFPTQQWDINAVYFDSDLGDNSFVSNLYSSETFNNFDSVITTVEAQLLDTATTQAAFPDNEVTFRVMSNNWYCDIVAFDGYDPIRRITIEQLYAQSASNTTAFARTSSLLINNENPNQSGFLAQFPNAAAAYSVRSLTGNTGTDGPKIVRVRRDSDNVEVDVYTDTTGFITLDSPISAVPAITGGIDGGTGAELETLAETLGEFVFATDDNPDGLASADTAKVVVWYDQSDTTYSNSNLPAEEEERGAPIRIRVVGGTYDSYEFDVYFDENETISLSSYVADTIEITDSNAQVTATLSNGTLEDLETAGMTEARVVVWYDQSGSGNDASQDVAGSQPTIYANNEIVTENGKAAIDFDGSDDGLNFTSTGYNINNLSTFVVARQFGTANAMLFAMSGSTGDARWYAPFSLSTFDFGYGNDAIAIQTTRTTDQSVFTMIAGSTQTNCEAWVNATSVGTTALQSASTSTQNGIGYFSTGSFASDCNIQEVLIWDADQSTNRISIEATINNYYDIYGTGNTGANEKLLDTYTGAAAYSLRKLRTAYNGPVNLSNRKDAKQQVAGSQPTLVSSGELVTKNGKAAALFSGSQGLAADFGTTINGPAQFYVNVEHTTSSVSMFVFSGFGDDVFGLRYDSNNSVYMYGGTVPPVTSNWVNNNIGDHLIFAEWDGASSEFRVDGSTLSTINTGTSSAEGLTLGLRYDGGQGLIGYTSELIMYTGNDQTNRPDIESNINNAFQIYSAAFPSALDTVPEAKAAYSVRRLTKEYTGPIITVNNGTTTKDFYADFWGNLDKTALTEFEGVGTLSITKWWDQSGRGEHLVATGESKPILDPATLNISVDSTNVFDSITVINDINDLTAGNKNLVAVFGGDVNDTIDLNVTTYTDLKEIIHYQ